MTFRLQHRRYRLPLKVAVRTARSVWREREGVIVRLEDAQGGVGFGEAAPLVGFGSETVDDIAAACRELDAGIGEERLAAVSPRLACLRNALAAARAEIADAGREANGGRAEAPPYLAVAALVPAGRAAIEVIAARAEAGFRTFKWKVGAGDLGDELALLDDVCAALPSGAKLRLDANGAWDRRQAGRWLERCADRPVEFVEQPVADDARGAEDTLRGLAADYPTPVALDESVAGDDELGRWLGAGWPGFFVIKLSLHGDAETALQKLAAAKAKVVFSSALETGIGARAALRRVFRWTGEQRALGFGVWPLFADGRFDGPVAAPFLRREDGERIDAEAIWNALN